VKRFPTRRFGALAGTEAAILAPDPGSSQQPTNLHGYTLGGIVYGNRT